jgi:hypothetical protein
MVEDPGVMPFYRGDMIVALKYIPGESSPTKRTKKSKGALHVIVKEAKGLIPARPNGNNVPWNWIFGITTGWLQKSFSADSDSTLAPVRNLDKTFSVALGFFLLK